MLRLVTHAQVHIIGRTHPNRILCNALRDSDLATRKRASSAIRCIRCENIFNLSLSLTGHIDRVTRTVFRGNDSVIGSCIVPLRVKTYVIQLVVSIVT